MKPFACTAAFVLALTLPMLLGGCTGLPVSGESTRPSGSQPGLTWPAAWLAPVPHQGQISDLRQWWRGLNGPLLPELIDAAQQASPTLAAAQARLEQARATRTAAGAALWPTLDAAASASRGVTQPGMPVANTTQVGLQTAWEVDLFGGNRAASRAAQARVQGAQAQWHEARVSVAAEVAGVYFNQLACQEQLALLQADAQSRSETARLSGLSTQAGFTAAADDALASASAADAASRVHQQHTVCEVNLKALVALSALTEQELRQKLATARIPRAPEATFFVASVPAQVLSQRPDLWAAEQELAAAALDVDASLAQRLPRLSLVGSVSASSLDSAGLRTDGTTWALGPLALTLPLFDGERRSANVSAARVRLEAAQVSYRAQARQAVREVEEALVRLHSAESRASSTQTAATGFRAFFEAAQARYQAGLGSLVAQEDARRLAIAADAGVVSQRLEQMLAWVALYRAAGGGWQASDLNPTSDPNTLAHLHTLASQGFAP